MNFLDLAKKRYSVLHYSNQPVEQWKLDMILKAGHLAPTACNRQPQRIYVIRTPEKKQIVHKATKCDLYFDTALLVCWDKEDCWIRSSDGKASGEIDASIVLAHMMLEAADLNIGSICVMSWDPELLKSSLAIPSEYEPTALLLLGYPVEAERPHPGHYQFRNMNETVFYI